MSRKSVNSDSAKKFKKIRNDLMNFERDEIKNIKSSNKNISILKNSGFFPKLMYL